ncbi:MAG: NFACT RNA binding domain-containing protein [Angelakisella sp.]
MALDGAYLHKIKQEIDVLCGARIDKVSQPTHDSVVLVLRGEGANRKLLLSAEPAGSKLQFTTQQLENPKSAPMFCMLLRKHLGSGRLLRCEQYGMDRILSLVFETVNELGDKVELSLVCEIMGRRSNIILVNEQGKVIDAIKRVDFVTSEVRQILSGISYQLPPAQQKRNPTTIDCQAVAAEIRRGRDIPLSKALLEQLEGVSPTVCRELAYLVCGGDSTAASLDAAAVSRLAEVLQQLQAALEPGAGVPTLVRDLTGKPVEFSFMPLTQYPDSYPRETYPSYSALLDNFYAGKDMAESMRQKGGDLRKQLSVARDRIIRKLAAQQQEFLNSQERDKKREFGDIIAANIYHMKKGDENLQAVNFFDPNQAEIVIPLDPRLGPSQNAQRYYGEYRKAATAEQKLHGLIESGTHEQAYLETVLSELDRAESDAELQAIRQEAVGQGYLRSRVVDRQKPVKLLPHRYLSSDGFVILSGRNNLQNDQLTLREAQNYDLWLHTQRIPGSHTIIITDGCHELPNRTIEEAAVIAACNSGAGESHAKVAVDYTYVKNVKKPRGAKPGMVIYDNYQTAMVQPDRARAALLEKK